MHLGRNVVTNVEVFALRALAEFLDESAELVSVNAGKMHRVADRRIPVVDVLVRPADRRRRDANQDLIGSRLRHGDIANLGCGCTVNR